MDVSGVSQRCAASAKGADNAHEPGSKPKRTKRAELQRKLAGLARLQRRADGRSGRRLRRCDQTVSLRVDYAKL